MLAQHLYPANTQLNKHIEKYHYQGKDSTFFVDRNISLSPSCVSQTKS